MMVSCCDIRFIEKILDELFVLGIQDEPMLAVNWSTTQLVELDISSTELTERALLDLFSVISKLTYLAVPYCDGFTDKVIRVFVDFFYWIIFIRQGIEFIN